MADSSISQQHRRKVREWLVHENDAPEKDLALSRIWNDTPFIEDIYATQQAFEKTWNRIKASEQKSSRRHFLNKLLRYAAILILPVITGLSVWFFSNKKTENTEMLECYVPNGKQESIVLSDGSQIQLNSGSLLIYPAEFLSAKRQVYLSGEGNFTVKGNPQKPFIVNAGTLDIEVLGTKFNIEAYPGSETITTTLEEGSVKVSENQASANALTIVPNQQIVYNSDENSFTIKQVNATDYSAWTTGELHFINKSLDEILFSLERKFDVRFLVDTEIKCADLYTMKFKSHETIEDALYVLQEIMGTIKYKREGHTIHLKLKRKEAL